MAGVPPKDAPAFSLRLLKIITRCAWHLKIHLTRAQARHAVASNFSVWKSIVGRGPWSSWLQKQAELNLDFPFWRNPADGASLFLQLSHEGAFAL